MQLRVYDEKKRKQYKFKENEGLQFVFDIENDTAEEVRKIWQNDLEEIFLEIVMIGINRKIAGCPTNDRAAAHSSRRYEHDYEVDQG